MTTTSHPRFAMVAGEASGDLLAASLLASLRQRWPALSAQGIGGPKMVEQGFEAWWPHHKLAVRGYVEVLGHFREIYAIRSQLTERLLRDKPDAFIGVDAPDFNLDLELKLKKQGVKSIHYISPSIWAWRGKRIEKIRQATDLLLCIFPFEPDIYAKQGVAAAYVGQQIHDGKLKPTAGMEVDVPKLGKLKFSDKLELIGSPLTTFSKDNIEQFHF